MPIEGLDAERCRARNRIAARRDGVETATLRFVRQEELSAKGQRGTLPSEPEGILGAINALQPEGAEPLALDQVYVHFLEAANGAFIPDRYAFLDRSTLRNIADDGARGISFMNSHRTGSMSAPSELPFGRTFAGRFNEDADGMRSHVGAYMLRATLPNGTAGPSTDDLDRMIRAGVVADVSVGLYGADVVCDVCGNELDAAGPGGDYLCDHVPGTVHAMTKGEISSQKSRGVPEGRASYSLCNGHMSEVSAVYDGAVPGAGIRKVLSLARRGVLGAETLAQGQNAFGAFFQLSSPDEAEPPTGPTFADHSQSVLTAVSEYLARVRDYAALREGKGRPLSPDRRAEFQRLHDELGQVLAATTPRADPAAVIALRARILRRQASRREAVRE